MKNNNSSDATNQLLKTLNNRGDYNRAFQLFENLVKQKNVSIKSLLTILNTCAQSGQIERGRQIELFINQSNTWKDHIRLQTSLINMYMKCQLIDQAERIFEKLRPLPSCDVVVYNAMLKGYLRNHKAENCFQCINKMPATMSSDNVTYILLLNACTILRDEKRGIELHNQLSSSLETPHVHLQNALIDFYGRINRIHLSKDIFEQMNFRETSTYNSLMKAYLENNMPIEVLKLFEEMKQNDTHPIGLLSYKPDLITFMAVCDACEKLGLFNHPDSSYEQFNWKKIFSRTPPSEHQNDKSFFSKENLDLFSV